MSVPTFLPTEPTALDRGRKRKLLDTVDLTAEIEDATLPSVIHKQISSYPTGNGAPQDEAAEVDGASDVDEQSESDHISFEDLLDHFESEPFINDDTTGLSDDEVAKLRARLRQVGVDGFFEETITQNGMDPRQLGVVFGINPQALEFDDDLFLRLLGLAVVRCYYKRRKLQQYNTIDDAAKLLCSSRNIMVITGAGISTSLGIPDFRSKGSGFYDKVRALGYEEPEEVFEINNFDNDPTIFYRLAGEILPDLKKFSPTHAFIRLLQDKERLQTNYTQNIDNLEALAGIDPNRIIQCHGSFATATCRKCKHHVPGTDIFDDIRAQEVAKCKRCIADLARAPPSRPQKRSKTRYAPDDSDDDDADDDIPQPGVMKPDITFFGEALPDTFFDRFTTRDAQATDLVVVIGTSLKVAPVSEMPNYLPHRVPHIFISREPIRHVDFDIQLLGNCDDVVFELCRRAGWGLAHEMLPKGFAVDVAPPAGGEGPAHHWRITPRQREIPGSSAAAADRSARENDDDGTARLHPAKPLSRDGSL